MKKQVIQNIIYVGYKAAYWIPIFLLLGCQNFLNEMPDNRVELEKVNVLDLMPLFYQTGNARFSLMMTDNAGLDPTVSKALYQTEMYLWQKGTTIGDPTRTFWTLAYNAIAHANIALEILRKNQSTAATEQWKKDKKTIEGVALVSRAYYHFMLVNLFAKHYSKNTADRDLGIPYLRQRETKFIVKYRRHTVAEVYQWIEEDLLKGLPLIDNNFFVRQKKPIKYHFNEGAALAFVSRYYLFKGEYEQCIKYSSKLLGAFPASYIRDLTAEKYILKYKNNDIFEAAYYNPSFKGNLLLSSSYYVFDFTGYGLTKDIASSLYPILLPPPMSGGSYPPKYAAVFYSQSHFNAGYGFSSTNGFIDVRLPLIYTRTAQSYPSMIWGRNKRSVRQPEIIFRGEEVLLNRAEAYLLKKTPDIPKAIADLQTLADRRYAKGLIPAGFPSRLTLSARTIKVLMEAYKGTVGLTESQALLEYILWERRKEFVFQGLRWLDIKRHRLPVVHALDGAQTRSAILKAEDPRKLWKIPLAAITVNSLQPNP